MHVLIWKLLCINQVFDNMVCCAKVANLFLICYMIPIQHIPICVYSLLCLLCHRLSKDIVKNLRQQPKTSTNRNNSERSVKNAVDYMLAYTPILVFDLHVRNRGSNALQQSFKLNLVSFRRKLVSFKRKLSLVNILEYLGFKIKCIHIK